MTGVIGSLGQSSSLRHVLDVARPPRHQLGKPWATESSIAPGAPQRSAKNRQFLPAAGTATGSPYSSPSGKTRLAELRTDPGLTLSQIVRYSPGLAVPVCDRATQ